MYLGDFNDLLFASDKDGSNPHPQSLLDGFGKAIEDCQLSELGLSGGRFTWEKSRGTNGWVREKLDRAFASVGWWLKFPLCSLKVFHTSVSDHNPILLELFHVNMSKKVFRFRFENIWLKEVNFIKDVSAVWKELPVAHLLPKLLSVSAYMARWGRTFFHKFREKIKSHKANLDRLVDCTDESSVKEYMLERDKLNNLLFQEEIYWKQRAKLFWLTEGDENTRFFHSSASARKRTNKINGLSNENGDFVSDQEGMAAVVETYFTELFAGEVEDMELEQIIGHRMISQEQNLQLIKDFSFEEFTIATKQMHPDKASGPDGLNPAFFQNFWPVMGKEIFEYCKDWLHTKKFPGELNSTNVVLIPKKENASCMKDLRPIALCNVLYKILAKVLANRLRDVLPEIISENQSAFIKGRSITDNVLVAFEVIHHMRRKNRGNEGEVALKLDISKAYDRVSWRFLRHRMQVMGFCGTWIDWMMMCVKTVSYNFCLNGSMVGPVIPKRGLRQGDPLSPYLFLFCVEGLSNAIDQASLDGNIHGSSICPLAPTISHLLFADDSFLFFRGTTEEATNVKSLLLNYEKFSGQSVNYQKSGVFYSANVRRDKQLEISNILGVHNEITGTKYLGLPLLIGRSKKRVFGYLKERVSKRIQQWQSKPISRAGKTVLIRNVAQAIPSYTMSCFLLPKTLCQELERLLNNFWWRSSLAGNKGINWHSWNSMSLSKSKGGLGFRNLYGFNIALLGKQCWNFMNNPDSLVSRLFRARYFPNSHFLQAAKGNDGSFIWNGIWTAKEELRRGFRWVLGNGENIVAVRDPWLRAKETFCVENSHRYEGRNELVSELLIPNSRQWNTSYVQEHFVEEDVRAILAIIVPQQDRQDRVVWSESSNGVYTAKAGYRFWYDQVFGTSSIPQSNGWNKIWRLQIPHKMKIFIWRFCRNSVPVRRRLNAKGVTLPITCPMCLNDIEHLLHVFFECNFARQCWDHVNLSYDMRPVEFAPDWLLSKINDASSEEVVKVCTVLWGIWYWRNKRVWEDKSVTPAFAMDGSFKSLSEWQRARRMELGAKKKGQVNKECRWSPPEDGVLKLNVDASVCSGAETFSVGMVLRDHLGSFLAGKNLRLFAPVSVVEAEVVGVREALSWIKEMHLQNTRVIIETDSLLTVQAIKSKEQNYLEVGAVIDDCKLQLQHLTEARIHFTRKQANRVAHEIARIPCLANCQNLFTSPPTCLLETLLFDIRN